MSQSAIIYTRFSTTEQSKGYSLGRQIKHGNEYVEREGHTLEAVLSDCASSNDLRQSVA